MISLLSIGWDKNIWSPLISPKKLKTLVYDIVQACDVTWMMPVSVDRVTRLPFVKPPPSMEPSYAPVMWAGQEMIARGT